jgi:DNA-directed RNA polymerase specialized sigma24 family protein
MGLSEDIELAAGMRGGDSASSESFVELYGKSLEAFLISKCSEGRSRDKASSIAADVVAECVSQGLLEKYSAKGSLEGWLKRIAHFRLINFWNSAEARKVSNPSQWANDEGGNDDVMAGFGEVAPDSEDGDAIAEMLRQAFVWSLSDLRQNHPETLVLLRFHWLYGVEQKRLGEAWERSAARVSRLITDGLERLGQNVSNYLREIDPLLQVEWRDCLHFCSRYNLVLFDEDSAADNEEQELVG